jgi:hypothetical protein
MEMIIFFSLFSDLFSYPDPVTNTIPDTHSTSGKRNKRLNKHQSTVSETRKRLFTSSKRLKEELGVRTKS